MKFPESKIAHQWLDGLKGIEIGGSSHNPFAIPGCINVDCEATNGHKDREVELCGERLPIDVIADGDDLPFADSSYDFVINSHVIEHMPDPIRAIEEWIRVVRDNGFILFVVPTRDMNPDDRKYPYTTVDHLIDDHNQGHTVATHPWPEGQGPRGHYHAFSPMRFAYFVGTIFGTRLELVEALEIDEKVGNGHTLLVRVRKNQS